MFLWSCHVLPLHVTVTSAKRPDSRSLLTKSVLEDQSLRMRDSTYFWSDDRNRLSMIPTAAFEFTGLGLEGGKVSFSVLQQRSVALRLSPNGGVGSTPSLIGRGS
jgi:hypothetical protein